MTDEQILALYDWETGRCFRCSRSGIDVTRISGIDTPSGDQYSVHACRDCVLAMEAERRRRAGREERPYRPGRIGRPEA
jgi:hypothetical protein